MFDVGFLLGNLDGEFDVVLVEVGVVDLEDVLLIDIGLESSDLPVECFDVLLVDVVVLESADLLLDQEDFDELSELALE